uniref:Uncharacterized protein n=1 Tax=Arundo donax TaxID=35708 RepID=A0A0A9HI09_ARUDO
MSIKFAYMRELWSALNIFRSRASRNYGMCLLVSIFLHL